MQHAGSRRRSNAGRFKAVPGLARRLALAACVAAGSATATAQPANPAVPTPPVVPQPSELGPRALELSRPALPERPAPPPELAKPDEDIRIDVAAFALPADAPAELRAALPALTARFIGRDRSFEDLANAAVEVTRWLQRELGWYLGYAYLPAQVPEPGPGQQGSVIQLALLEGRLDRVVLNWDDKIAVRREVVEAYLARLVPGEILRVREVERVVFLVNDLRGLVARFEVRAGSRPGTAQLVVTPRAENRWSAKVEADGNGSRFMGAWRVGALGQWNTPLGRGDGLTGTVLASTTGGLGFALVGYTTPIGSDGIKAGLSASAVRYALDKEEFPLELEGDAATFNAYALYPWVRSRNLNVFVLASAEAKRYEDRNLVNRTKKNVDTLALGSTGDFRDSFFGGAVSTYDVAVTSGRVRYPQGRPSALDDAPSFVKLQAGTTRLQDVLTGRLLGYLAVRGQWTDKNLDTTEQFRIGGPDGVRGFAPGEGTGDIGLIATIEARLLPPEDWFGRVAREMVASVFFDVGHVQFRAQPAADSRNPRSETFSSIGVGLAWVRPGSWALRFSLASPLDGTPRSDPRERDPRLYAQATLFFD